MKAKDVKVIAFYLPQYHEIEENNKWWGKGFTEWTNVKKATPQFKGHYQPRIPLNRNYYSLETDDEMIKQAKMATDYGIYGFCYYHYWFGKNKQLLEKPVDNMLNDESVNIPFCLCWANENWSRNWDGGNKEVIMAQDYGDEESWHNHIEYLVRFFRDKRYIRIENKPVFIIYKPELIECYDEMIAYWNEYLKENGENSLYIISQYPQIFREDYKKFNLDAMIKFEPAYTNLHFLYDSRIRHLWWIIKMRIFKWKGITVRNYKKTWEYIVNESKKGENLIPGAFVDWDNTPRNQKGTLFIGASPKIFKKYFSELVRQVINNEYNTEYIFINAWNEWGEGAYLEPDEKNGYAYLEAVKESLNG